MQNSVPPGPYDPADLMFLRVPVGDGVLVGAFGRLLSQFVSYCSDKDHDHRQQGRKGGGQVFHLITLRSQFITEGDQGKNSEGRNLETGVKTEALEGRCLLSCS